jgi:hypothetical protein
MTSLTTVSASNLLEPPRRVGFLALFRRSLAAHAPVATLVGAYCLGYLWLAGAVEDWRSSGIGSLAASFVLLTLPLLALSQVPLRLHHVATKLKPEHPIPALLSDLWRFFSDGRRIALGLPMIALNGVFMRQLADQKANLTAHSPFSWDEQLAALDRALHFGVDPRRLLHPVLGFPSLTFLVNVNYMLWFFVVLTLWMHFAFQPRPSIRRTRFFVAFLLTWIVGGSLLAVLFSSAGPCFYARLGLAPGPYADLMAYLRGVHAVYPLWSLDVQDALWASYSGAPGIDGISAMPSMHNAVSFLFLLAVPRRYRLAWWLLFVHAVLIFLGSIHLGFHYALDGYLAWVVALLAWLLAKPIAVWWLRRPGMRELALLLRQSPVTGPRFAAP